ncbi:MAG: VanZ family protein [Dysgonamonadaceae bacterium]|nr:VanZ family protein [Dysgonamonadaceae bacterium]MDD4246710.1 VanZ family protein [Dysgonamonadaceae bacterium]MDD4604755.1 VanZ family protein [Dysgonamonadaceae bacterium]
MSSYIRYTVIPGIVALLIFYVTCIVNVDSLPVPDKVFQYDKIAHFGMFFVLSAAIYYDYYRLHKGRPNKLRWIFFGLIIPIVYGGVIEIVQERFFGRSGELMDFVADSLGSLSATAVAFIYINRKKKR